MKNIYLKKETVSMNTRKLLISLIMSTALLFMLSTSAIATPGATMLYNETDLGGGTWQYDYTFYNTSTTEDLYSVYLYFDQERSFDWVNIPSGWDSTLNGFTPFPTTLADTYSIHPDYDIAAGNNLGYFSFTVDYQAGDISYDAFFSGDNTLSGTTSLVPEPISSTLFIVGGATLGFRRFRKRG